MNHQYGSLDPPRTFSQRLRQLNENLQAMVVRLKDTIAEIVSTAVGRAIKDVIRRLLGDQEPVRDPDRFDRPFDRDDRDHYGDRFDDNGRYEDREDPWDEENRESLHRAHTASTPTSSRWGDAFRTAAQTAMWWLRTQSGSRPVLTTTIVALTAGGTALFAGPTLAACVSIVASIASLLLTADSVRTAGQMAAAS